MKSRREFCQLMAAAAFAPGVSLTTSGNALAQGRENTVRIAWPYDTASLDAVGIGAQRSTWCVSLHLYDRLVTYAAVARPDGTRQYDPAELRPELAERWEIS